LLMAGDWSVRAYFALAGDAEVADYVIMFFHAFGVLWASLFFYNKAIELGGAWLAWLTLLVEWLDVVFMLIVILILHDVTDGNCFDRLICCAYFGFFVVDVFVWFTPIMFGFANTERRIHIHMIFLDVVSDLPLVIIVFVKRAYQLHWFIFLDMALKIFLLIRSIAYHGIVKLAFRSHELKQQETADDKAIQKEQENARSPDEEDDEEVR